METVLAFTQEVRLVEVWMMTEDCVALLTSNWNCPLAGGRIGPPPMPEICGGMILVVAICAAKSCSARGSPVNRLKSTVGSGTPLSVLVKEYCRNVQEFVHGG